jgi:peptide/nickel transport system substrate-binding protein
MKNKLMKILLLSTALLVSGCNQGSENTEALTFNILSNWDKVGMKNHLNSGSNVGPINWFSVESLVQYVRSTDEVFYILAESVTHNSNHTSTVRLREDAKWQTGEDFVSDDVIGYYYLNQGEVTNYIQSFTKVSDKEFIINWKVAMEPNDRVKTLLLAVDRSGSVQYSIFHKFVDKAKEVLDNSPSAPEGYTGWAPFGHLASQNDQTVYLQNYTEFKAFNPSTFVATGPYMPYKQSETEMILIRNDNYWARENLKFKYIKATNSLSDLNQIYSMLQSGKIDYQDGLAPENTLNAIINNNPNMAHYKMFDPGAIGIVFNLNAKKKTGLNGEKEALWTDKVREAFEYIFDRDKIKDSGNPYAVTSYYSMMSMAPSEAEVYMSDESFNRLPSYSHDESKAAQLLQEDGWNKEGESWYKNGVKMSLTLHYDGSHPGQSGAAIAAQAALNAFGIDCTLKKASDFNSWLGSASSTAFAQDMSMCWTDLNMSFSYPTGSFIYFYKDITAKVLQLEKFTADDAIDSSYIGKYKLQLEKADGSGYFYPSDVLDGMYCLSDEELTSTVDDLVLGLAKKNYGVQMYQNVTGSFFNKAKVGGLPNSNLWDAGRNMTYVPNKSDNYDDFMAYGKLNFYYAYASSFISGMLYPTISEK